MAFKTTYEIRCSCGAQFTEDLFEYVFTEYDKELKDAILSGEFNWTTCPSCRECLHIENRFLYRDEKNKLWVWVCRRGEEQDRDELYETLMEKNVGFQDHHLDNKDDYRKYLVFGRDALLELLLKKDRDLKQKEGKNLKSNTAMRLIFSEEKEPGFLFLSGEKIRLAIPLKLPAEHETVLPDSESRQKWLRSYAQGVNIHNPYSSFLDVKMRARWNRILEKESRNGPAEEFEAFATRWASYKTDLKKFSESFPETRRFFDDLKTVSVTRKIRSMNPKQVQDAGKRKQG
jgi:hypothetical protein